MKNISVLLFITLSLANMCLAQTVVIDDFNHNDKRLKGLWRGDTSHFIINASHQLQLNNNSAGISFVATSFAPAQNLEWNVYVRQAFAGSANNYGRIYLFSSQFNLTQPTNGYFLQLGEAGSNDAVELFRQTGTTVVSVCRGANAAIAAAFAIRLNVTRNDAGNWQVFVDYGGGTEFVEVASGTDITFTTGQWMGMVCVYTAGNATRFYYDDVYAGPPKADPLPPDVAEPFDLVVNEFFPDPSPSVGLPEQEFVEIYNRSSKTFDLTGWKLGDATSLQSMPAIVIRPGEYVVVNNSVSLNNAGDVIKIIDNHNTTIDTLTYSLTWYQDETKSAGGYTIERLNPEMPSTDPTNWYVSQSGTGGTPGTINSVFGRNPDSKSPVITNISLLNDSTIAVKFSEPVMIVRGNYALAGSGTIGDIQFNVSDSTAILRLDYLVNGTDYSLKVSDFSDFAGNVGASKAFDFRFFIPHPVKPKDILITELMADPAPVVQMPEAEYVELFNRSAHPVSLAGWHLDDATTRGVLPSVILMPGCFLLLTSTTNSAKFQHATGVTSFPSLGNLGDKIVLRDENDVAIDSVTYNSTWYHNLEKADGGWSLELIDISNACGEGDNWAASEDVDGGTPGQQNSVFASKPDLTPPEITNVFAASPDTLVISFNEKLHASLGGMFDLPGRALFKDQSKREIFFMLDESLSTGRLYSIAISDVADCNGNRMIPVTLNFSLPEKAKPGDLIVNEVLFNPRPNGADFIELFNRTPKYVNLKGWSLSGEVIAVGNDILAPYSYRVFTSSLVATESHYPSSLGKPMTEVALPSLPDDEGMVTLLDPGNALIDQFSYKDDMHSPIVGNTEGVSLERISPEASSDDRNNWHSANGSVGFATPGYVNSSSMSQRGLEVGSVNVVPEVINPSTAVMFSQIYYQFDQAGLVANVSVIDLEGRVIKSIASNETIGAEGSFHWDGDRDEGGVVRCGYYVVWFQTFSLEGRVNTYRSRVVVGF